MNYQLIMLPNPILVSDEAPKYGEWCKSVRYNQPQKFGLFENSYEDECKKIIAGIPELPQLDLSLVAGEINYCDAKIYAQKYIDAERESREKGMPPLTERQEKIRNDINKYMAGFYGEWFIKGFNANPKKYTEEDIRKAIKYGRDFGISCTNNSDYMTEEELKNAEQTEEEFFKSLQQSKVYNVELEMMYKNGRGHGLIKTKIPNITNNTIKVTKII